jgi:exosortase
MGPHSARINPSSLSRIGYIALIIILLIGIYGTTFVQLFRDWWNSTEQAQGLVIVPCAALMAWLRRRSLAAEPAAGEWRGLWVAGAGCALHLLSLLAAGVYASQLSFVLVLAGVVWTLWGLRRLRLLALPMLLLAAAIPLPSLVYASLSMPLRLLASRIACGVADLAGIAVYREGNIIHLAGISLGVWEACSGLNSLSTLIVGAVLLGFLLCRLPLTRLLVCLAAIPIALMANIVRVTGTAILSDWRPAYAMGFYHAFSGWLLFMVGALGLYGAAIGLRRLFDK